MIQTTQLTIPPAQLKSRSISAARICEECGYSRRGILANQPCPECGSLPSAAAPMAHPHTTWSRAVFVGLVLLLIVTLDGASSVLYQPFAEQFGGTAPILNLPGPKLWAAPLLQRPIGNAPEEPGVAGTRTAMLGLIAVWLITTPSQSARHHRDQRLRFETRWASVVLFGLGFGLMMGAHGLWIGDLPIFRFLLVAAIELPATSLLYFYLSRLARHVPGHDRRATFERLNICVPLTIFAGAAILGLHWLLLSEKLPNPPQGITRAVSMGYGAVAMICGVIASTAVGSLAAAYFRLAFPRARRWIAVMRIASGRVRQARSWLTSERIRHLAVGGGLLLLLITMIAGNDMVFWISTRWGLAGNLPFVDFPGPKVWAGAAAIEQFSWRSMLTGNELITLNLLAIWLIATPLRPLGGGNDGETLRAWTRWLPIFLIGGLMCAGSSAKIPAAFDSLDDRYRSELFATATLACELPASVLLYLLLARIATEVRAPTIARQLKVQLVLMVLVMASSLIAFVLSRDHRSQRFSYTVLTLCALYGGLAMTIAAWATTTIVALGAVLLQRTGHPGPEIKIAPRMRGAKWNCA
jgi:hypothetical protein